MLHAAHLPMAHARLTNINTTLRNVNPDVFSSEHFKKIAELILDVTLALAEESEVDNSYIDQKLTELEKRLHIK